MASLQSKRFAEMREGDEGSAMNLLARSLTLSFCLVTTITLRADEFEDSLTAALKAYKENKIDDASTALLNYVLVVQALGLRAHHQLQAADRPHR